MFGKILKVLAQHKIIVAIIAVLIVGSGYFGYKAIRGNGKETRYVTSAVEKGTITTSVSGTGQVSASNQVDIKPKVSGDVVWVGIEVGQEVGIGQSLVVLDDTDAKKAITDATLDLQETQLKLDKDTAQASFDYQKELNSLQNAKDDLVQEYKNTLDQVSSAFRDLPSVVTGTQNILYGQDLDKRGSQQNINVYKNLFIEDANRTLIISLADAAEKDYATARAAYDENFLDFKNTPLSAEASALEELLGETIVTAQAITQAVKSETNLLDTIVDIAQKKNQILNSQISTFQSSARSYLETANSSINSLSAQERSLEDAKTAISDIEENISILKINNPTGINPLDLQISQNSLEKKKVALKDLETQLADYVIRPPFAGIVAKVSVKKGDTVSTGTALATFITKQKVAEITLNEVDAAKIKLGQKTILTFDALEGLTVAGEVSEMGTIGTVTQGVVSYDAKIGFDVQDERVKPGMSVSAAIITDIKQDVLLVSNSAIKQQNNTSYVEILGSNNQVQTQAVEVGLSNDTMSEIISGLKEGDKVVTQTITTGSTQGQSQQNSSLRIPGITGGEAGGFNR